MYLFQEVSGEENRAKNAIKCNRYIIYIIYRTTWFNVRKN